MLFCCNFVVFLLYFCCIFVGPLPKMDERMKNKPKFKAVDRWNRKRALFGQNDYIGSYNIT